MNLWHKIPFVCTATFTRNTGMVNFPENPNACPLQSPVIEIAHPHHQWQYRQPDLDRWSGRHRQRHFRHPLTSERKMIELWWDGRRDGLRWLWEAMTKKRTKMSSGQVAGRKQAIAKMIRHQRCCGTASRHPSPHLRLCARPLPRQSHPSHQNPHPEALELPGQPGARPSVTRLRTPS